MNTELEEKVSPGFVWRTVAPFLAGNPIFRLGHRPPVVLPVSSLALGKIH